MPPRKNICESAMVEDGRAGGAWFSRKLTFPRPLWELVGCSPQYACHAAAVGAAVAAAAAAAAAPPPPLRNMLSVCCAIRSVLRKRMYEYVRESVVLWNRKREDRRQEKLGLITEPSAASRQHSETARCEMRDHDGLKRKIHACVYSRNAAHPCCAHTPHIATHHTVNNTRIQKPLAMPSIRSLPKFVR